MERQYPRFVPLLTNIKPPIWIIRDVCDVKWKNHLACSSKYILVCNTYQLNACKLPWVIVVPVKAPFRTSLCVPFCDIRRVFHLFIEPLMRRCVYESKRYTPKLLLVYYCTSTDSVHWFVFSRCFFRMMNGPVRWIQFMATTISDCKTHLSFQIQSIASSSIYSAMFADAFSRLHSLSYGYINMNHVYTCRPPCSSCFPGNCQSLTSHQNRSLKSLRFRQLWQ